LEERLRRYTAQQKEFIRQKVKELIERGVIEPGSGAWRSAVHLAKKKDGTWRFCIDYRRLNEMTLVDSFPIPNIDDMLDNLIGARYFSKLDLTDGFWHIPIRIGDRNKTGFMTPDGLYQWKMLPMHLTNSPSIFQRAMQDVLRKYMNKFCMVYIDDIIIYSHTLEGHIEHVKLILTALRERNFYAKLSKCKFLVEEIEFLGHVITKDGVKTDPRKTEALKALPIPTSAQEVRRFLGMSGYYRKFVPNYAEKTNHLRMLIRKNAVFNWTDECNKEFNNIKELLGNAPIMAFPDFSKGFILTTDASKEGFGAILSQIQNGAERVIAYASKSTNDREKNYFPTELECAAIVWAIDKFKTPYLLDQPFNLVTDHSALKSFKTISGKSAKLERWSIKLQDVKFTIQHRAGTSIPHVDCLSRGADSIRSLKLETRFMKAQRKDPCLRNIWTAYDRLFKEYPSLGMDQDIEINPSLWNSYVVKSDGKVYHRLYSDKWHKSNKIGVDRLVIPEKFRVLVMKEFHNKHQYSFKKCYISMQQAVFWNNMYRDMKTFCESCLECQEGNPYTTKTSGKLQKLKDFRKFELIHLDLWSGVPKSTQGNEAVLVMTDRATRYCMGVPIRNKEAPTVAKAFIDHWVKTFGMPEGIMTDGGGEFKGVWEEIYKMLKIRHFVTTPYHPQANGLVESKNKAMIQTLEKHCYSTQKNWDKYVAMAVLEYNCTMNSTTQETPYFLVFGMEPRTPLELLLKINPYDESFSSKHWKTEFLMTLFQGLKRASSKIQEQQKRNAERWLAKVNSRTFKVGEMVMIWKNRQTDLSKGIHKKLSTRWKGPFHILPTSPEYKNCYYVEVISKKGEKKPTIINIKNIKKYHERPSWMRLENLETDEDPIFLEERDHLDPTDDIFDTNPLSKPHGNDNHHKKGDLINSKDMVPHSHLGQNMSQSSMDDKLEVIEEVDVSIVLNEIRSWWCAKVISTRKEKGQERYRVKPLAKMLKPKWVTEKFIRKCPHRPQLSSPHESAVAPVFELSVEERSSERVHQLKQSDRYVCQLQMQGSDSQAHSVDSNMASAAEDEVVLMINGKSYKMTQHL